MELKQVDKRPHECCNVLENMVLQKLSPGSHKETCKVCGANHYVMNAVELGGQERKP